MTPKTARSNEKTKKERLAQEIAKAVGAGRQLAVETVDFNDPNRPKTCLEVDFPILLINQISQIEGNAGKPIYQMSKWWARRRSSVFRAMLLAGAMKAPEDPAQAAKLVWDAYYANHQKKGALKNLKVADIFMGGGTTIVEGSRLGMQMYGCDLNPVAWFIVKNEMAKVDPAEVQALLDEIESEVKPQIMPFYACDCPRGHRGKWTRVSTGEVMDAAFDPLTLGPDGRKEYRYEGPEVIYVFWSKHGPCQITGCGHRTPIMSSSVMAVKTLTVKAWEDFQCEGCGEVFDVEASDARMAPGVPFVAADGEKRYALLQADASVKCPKCGNLHHSPDLPGKAKNKKVDLSLLVHPDWMKGSPRTSPNGDVYGGSTGDEPESTARWYREREKPLHLIEVRGTLPETLVCPDTGIPFITGRGTYPQRLDKKTGELKDDTSRFVCGADGNPQVIVDSIEASGDTAPIAPIAIQGYCSACESAGQPYSGRFFAPPRNTHCVERAEGEWQARKSTDLADYWPVSEIPFGHMTHQRQPLPQHGYTHWWKMFSPRQLLTHALLLKAITHCGNYEDHVRDFVLGGFQQYLRNQNTFCFWNWQRDTPEPALSNANFHPKASWIENSVFHKLGRGNWTSCTEGLLESLEWADAPWEIFPISGLTAFQGISPDGSAAKSVKIGCGDSVLGDCQLSCSSATDVALSKSSQDLVITDPPFEGLVHYSELADFFYVWLRLTLKHRFPKLFTSEYCPKTLEAVENKARQPDDPKGFYKKILTESWNEAIRDAAAIAVQLYATWESQHQDVTQQLKLFFDDGEEG